MSKPKRVHKLTVYLDPELAKLVKIRAIEENKTMREFIESALAEKLKTSAKAKP